MCGRTVFTISRARVARVTGVDASGLPATVDLPKYNQCPMTGMVTVVQGNAFPKRSLVIMKWGLEPRFPVSHHLTTINARVEGVRTSRLYGPLIVAKRCVVIVDAYYEWDQRTTPHHPYLIRNKDSVVEIPIPLGESGHAAKPDISSSASSTVPTQSDISGSLKTESGSILPMGVSPLLIAGLYDVNPVTGQYSCTLITTDSVGEAAPIHSRMPMLLSAETAALWLSELSFDDVIGPVVKANKIMANELQCLKVSTLVNSISNKSIDVTLPENEVKKRSFEKGLGQYFTKKDSPKKLKLDEA